MGEEKGTGAWRCLMGTPFLAIAEGAPSEDRSAGAGNPLHLARISFEVIISRGTGAARSSSLLKLQLRSVLLRPFPRQAT